MLCIPSLFRLDGNGLAYNEITPGAEWVTRGEGKATRKEDGICCLIKDGVLFKFVQNRWKKVQDTEEDSFYWRAYYMMPWPLKDGTYELCGPRIKGNPEDYDSYILSRHGSLVYGDVPTTFAELKAWFRGRWIEGIVWHHPDGRMVKIEKVAFGLPRQDTERPRWMTEESDDIRIESP